MAEGDGAGAAVSYRAAGNLEPCGTEAAARRHKRHYERMCAACREAHAAADRRYYAKRKQRKDAAR
jgi:hypothetical protein